MNQEKERKKEGDFSGGVIRKEKPCDPDSGVGRKRNLRWCMDGWMEVIVEREREREREWHEKESRVYVCHYEVSGRPLARQRFVECLVCIRKKGKRVCLWAWLALCFIPRCLSHMPNGTFPRFHWENHLVVRIQPSLENKASLSLSRSWSPCTLHLSIELTVPSIKLANPVGSASS